MAHRHSSSSVSMASDRDVDEGDFLDRAESIESTNEVQTATAASLIGTRPTQVHVNPRRVSGTPSISSTISSSTVTPASSGAIRRDDMPPPPTTPRTVHAPPVVEYPSDTETGPPSPTASTASFFTSTSGAEQSAYETDAYLDAADGYSSRGSTETIPAVAAPVVGSVVVAPGSGLELSKSTRPAVTASDGLATRAPEAVVDGSTISGNAKPIGASATAVSAPIAGAASGNGTTKTATTSNEKAPAAISEKAVESSKKIKKWKWIIIIALILAIAIGVGVGVGVGVGTKKNNSNNNSNTAGGASSSPASSTAVTSSSVGASSSAASSDVSAVTSTRESPSMQPSTSRSPSASATVSTSESMASSTREASSFSTVTTTRASASRSRSSTSTMSSVSSDTDTRSPSSTTRQATSRSISIFRSIYTTTFPTSVETTRTYLDFPFRTTVVVTTTAVRTATYTMTLSQ
ncbi:hypothetical protein V1517DRAFT_313865 [Lipomyces orientalis]|uniref:Uncharacterized protein n=1 Tax=Lipomyces orientalis TaxID=1233043 RepID=A0ACC3TWN7_9ASCO